MPHSENNYDPMAEMFADVPEELSEDDKKSHDPLLPVNIIMQSANSGCANAVVRLKSATDHSYAQDNDPVFAYEDTSGKSNQANILHSNNMFS